MTVIQTAALSENSARILELLGSHGTRFEFECYDLGHLYNLAHFVDEGLLLGTKLAVAPMLFQESVQIHLIQVTSARQ